MFSLLPAPFHRATPRGVASVDGVRVQRGELKEKNNSSFANVDNCVRGIDSIHRRKGCESLANSENIDPDALIAWWEKLSRFSCLGDAAVGSINSRA